MVGKQTLDVILSSLKRKSIPTILSPTSFRFGDTVVKSLGMVEVAIETPSHIPEIMMLMDIVPVNVPELLGLDVLDSESFYADNVTNCLVHRRVTSRSRDSLSFEDVWSVPIVRHDGHLYAKMRLPSTTFYTTAQLTKLN